MVKEKSKIKNQKLLTKAQSGKGSKAQRKILT